MIPFSGLSELQKKIKDIDLILEVHDARVRYSPVQKITHNFYTYTHTVTVFSNLKNLPFK